MRLNCNGLKVKTLHYLLFLSRAQSYAERLRLGLAVIHGEAQCSESDMADGRHSPPCVRNTTGHTGLELPCKNARFSHFLCRFVAPILNRFVQKIYPCLLFLTVKFPFLICHTMVKFSKKCLIISASSTTWLHSWYKSCRQPNPVLICANLFWADDSAVSHSHHRPYSQEIHFCVTACFNSTDTLLLLMLHLPQAATHNLQKMTCLIITQNHSPCLFLGTYFDF